MDIRKNKKIRCFAVGDSTLSEFSDAYFYPRYGWATQLCRFLRPDIEVHDLALSGRSSRSFISEPQYAQTLDELGEGDILIIGFGHNDEKSADATRFTDARLPSSDAGSFGYYLNKFYIESARERGALPILCTPIVRASETDDYTTSCGHFTKTGDYAQAIRDLGAEMCVPTVDLCARTRELYQTLGYEHALRFHAVVAGRREENGELVPDMATVDCTHLNIYGARMMAYIFAREIANIPELCHLVADGISEPQESELAPLEGYEPPSYTPPRLDEYVPAPQFATQSEGWYGTAFGATGDDPRDAATGYIARQTGEWSFTVGQSAGTSKGKIARGTDGFAFVFTPLKPDDDFMLYAACEVLRVGESEQSAFGLMLRDDCVIDQSSDSTASANYITAGALLSGGEILCNFYREGGELHKPSDQIFQKPHEHSKYFFLIERVGQRITVRTSDGEREHRRNFFDFDLFARDTERMYVGGFATRGTVVELSDVIFTLTGKSQGA